MVKRFLYSLILVVGLAVPACAAEHDSLVFINRVQLMLDHGLLPEEIPFVEGTSHGEYLVRVANAANKLGVKRVVVMDLQRIEAFKNEPALWGYFDRKHSILFVEIDLPINTMLVTMVHELGHHLQPEALDGTSGGQIFAEAVAFIVCQKLGLNTFLSSATYAATLPEFHWVAQRYAKEIDEAVASILKEL
jgi:hypothetical protein